MEWYSRELTSNTLTSEEEFDSWLTDIWYSHQKTGVKPEQLRTGNTNDAMCLHIYVEGESNEPLTLQVQKREYSFIKS